MDKRLETYETKMQKTMQNLMEEFNSVRAGRANPHILDKIMVDYYGTPTPLQSVANVSVPEPRMIQIAPWEASLVKEIEKAINMAEIGINPTNDGKVIRLVFPELTEERRKDLAKDVKKYGENAKVAVRNIRRDAMDAFKKLKKTEDISEDEIKDLEDDAQKLTDRFVKEIDEAVEKKSKEIMTV
ncbi:MAG: ribosome recycling factor [Lachnospiraceae bacterium]|nr:ribosome recycling factor [Lachnospiraceae bacterium]